MAFKIQDFKAAQFKPRVGEVPVPELQPFFENGENPVWRVRGLTGIELARANDAADRNKKVSAVVEGVLSSSSKKIAKSVKQVIDPDTPQDIAKRLEHLMTGSTDPECDLELAKKICERYPIEFYAITNKILQLTGKGQSPGKAGPSGKTQKSGRA
jgi:hypothetical protein